LKRMAQAGVSLCGSSDAPVQSVDPFLQMRGMREFFVEEQSLSAYEALKTYTVNGGLMLGEKKGILRAGWEASFFTCTEDVLTIASAKLEGLHAQALWLHGKRYKPLPDGLGVFARLLTTRPRKI
ncbi:MAG: amidohydrolase family protein, partial [Raoultibacter sp.]